jgi:DNA-binding NtrC family response regulator
MARMAATILIADDDPVQRRLVENMVLRSGFQAVTVESGDAAMARLTDDDATRIDAMVLDLVMPGLDGLGVLTRLRDAGVALPVIVQTAHGGIDNVVSAMRAGAHDFVVKPVGLERLQVSLRNALNASALKGELQRIRRSREGRLTFADIITRSTAMAQVLRTAEKAATSSIPVLIEGESGVGKELIARAIHGSSERAAKPFVAVNCGAIPDNLVESTLFGHEKGSFTGATERHIGKFVEASGGTLFLDEVSELPLAAQVKLLRALQEGEVEAVGGRKPVKVDVRIISATNRNLLERAKSGHFREDLFYRLHVLPLTVPPLRARPEDVPHLLRHFLARFCAEENRNITTVAADALAALTAFTWPGNVRQLENAVYRAVVISDSGTLGLSDFPLLAAAGEAGSAAVSIAAAQEPLELTRQQPHMLGNEIPIAPAPPGAALSLLTVDGEVRPIEDIESDVIRFAIAHYRGQMSEVARRLKIGRSTLYRKLESMDGSAPEPADGD